MVAVVNMKLIGRVQLPTIAVVFLAIVVESGAQERCASPMSVPGSKTNTIIIQNVSELSPPNTVLKKLIFAGSDAEISLKMTTVNDNIRFNESTRELIVNKSFNVTDGNPNNIYVSIACTASPGATTTFQIVIQVYDMNNNAPWFANLPYSVNISERTSVNSSVFDGVQAVDADPSDRGYLIYAVADNAIFSSYFSFPVSTVGNLVLMKTLDYERIQSFNLTVTVMDNGNNLTVLGRLQPQHTATTSVLVTILPADDYNPVFNRSTYTGVLNIELNRSTVSLEATIGASIKYARPDERFIFSIVQDGDSAHASYFGIEDRTGLIRVSSLSSQISSDVVAFQIQATRVGQDYRYGRALVKLNVHRSTKPLRFTQRTYSASVEDSAPLGTLAATVIAIEGSSSPVYYFNADIKEFTIDSKTGEIRTTTTISYKASKLYNFTVTANDSTNTDVCRVILIVVQQNRRIPHFAQNIYTFVISKDTSFVGQITATDEDPNSVLNYQLIDPSSYFTVDKNGRLFCNCSSAAGHFSSSSTPGNTHSMVLIAEDDGDPVPLQTSALVVLTWNTSGQPVRPIPVCDGIGDATFNAYYIAVVVLGVTAGLFLIIVLILILCLCRRNGMQSDPRPRVTIEVDGTSQKSQNYSGFQGNSKSGNGFEVATEYSPYFAYGGGVAVADVSAQASSNLSSSEILQKLRAYRGVPTPSSSSVEKPFNPNDDTDSRTASELSRKPPQHHHHHHHQQHRSPPYSSTSIGTFSSASSPPSSRVERYQFEDDEEAATVGRHVQYPKSRSTRQSSLGTVPEARCLGGGGGDPPGGRFRGRGLQPGTASADAGDTSSTETLVTRAGKPGAKRSNVSFVDNVGGYLSSQEIDASSSALQRSDDDPAITVYY